LCPPPPSSSAKGSEVEGSREYHSVYLRDSSTSLGLTTL
jgi:hypothetical protein